MKTSIVVVDNDGRVRELRTPLNVKDFFRRNLPQYDGTEIPQSITDLINQSPWVGFNKEECVFGAREEIIEHLKPYQNWGEAYDLAKAIFVHKYIDGAIGLSAKLSP